MNKLDTFNTFFSDAVAIDPNKIKYVYIYMKAPIRKEVIKVVCQESNIEFQDPNQGIAALTRTGEIFPAMIIELLNKNVLEIDFFVVPVGGIRPNSNVYEPVYYWTTLIKKLNQKDGQLKEHLNTIRSDDSFYVNTLSGNINDLVKRVVKGKYGTFIVDTKKPKTRGWDQASTGSIEDEAISSVISDIKTDSVEIKLEGEDLNATQFFDAETGSELPKSEPEETHPDIENDDDMDSDDDDDTESVVHQINSLSTNSKPKLPLFKETENCDAWVDKCIFLIEMGGIDNAAKKVQHLCSNLPAPIQETVITELALLDKEARTVKAFTETLNKACQKNNLEYETLLKNLKYNADTHLNLRNFYYRIKQLVKQTLGSGCDRMVETVSFKEFLSKLPPKVQKSPFLREYRKEKTDIMQIVDKCAELYNDFKGGEYSEINQVSHFKKGNKQNFNRGGRKFPKQSLNAIDKKIVCHFCGIPGHKKNECRKLKAQNNSQGKQEIICHNCGKRGHKSPECRLPKKEGFQGKKTYGNKPSHKAGKDITCNFCGIKGHKEANCFKKNNANRREVPYKRRS